MNVGVNRKKVLITCALPYANGPLHFGHIAGAYLPGDCYARYARLQGHDVLFLCGSDEYGVAIALSAQLAGRSPQSHVDLFHEVNRCFFAKLKFSFDHFSRTSWPGHVEVVHQFFMDLLHNGYIEEKTTQQLYSESDAQFLADRYVVGTCPRCGFVEARGDECQRCAASFEATDLLDPRSKISGARLTLRPTNHWFLRLDRFKEKLSHWLAGKAWKSNVLHFAQHYVDELKPRCITRDLAWGVPLPLPGTEGKVFYVWFDAPIGYISASKEWALARGQPDKWKEYWLDPQTQLVQFIGKDNIPFHAVFFPAMCMGQNQPYKLVDELPANEFYNLEGRQFSKSEGWTIDLDGFFAHFSSDQIRYAIAANAPETQDSEFSWRDFQTRCTSELVGKYGNLIHRVLTFVQTRCGGTVPAAGAPEEVDLAFIAKTEALVSQISEAYAHFRLRQASALIMELAHQGNAYFDTKKPWADAKSPSTLPRMHTTLSCCLGCLKALALTSSPIIPDAAQALWILLGYGTVLETAQWDEVLACTLEVGRALPAPHILFTKVEDELILPHIETLAQLTQREALDKRPKT